MEKNQNKKPSATKTTKRVTANKNVLSKSTSGTAKKFNSTAKKAVATTAVSAIVAVGTTKVIKKMGGKSIAIILACFILALAIGAGLCFFIGKNDKFEIVGNDELSFSLEETYKDEGVEIKEFGIDISKNAITETNLKQNADGNYYAEEAGTYYILYKAKSLKFGYIYPTQKIRLITFVEPSEGENVNG